MAAYDNVSLAGPPNIATAGNYAQMLMQGLENIGKDYQQGQQNRYQQRQQDLFQSPDNQAMLKDAINSGNYTPLLQKLMQTGGASTAAGLIPSLMSQQAGSQVAGAIGGGGGGQPAAAPAAASPASITPPASGGGQPRTSETEGGDRINNLAADRGIDLDHFLAKNPVLRNYMDRDLSPAEAANIGKRMDAFRGFGGPAANPPEPPPTPDVKAPDAGGPGAPPSTSAGGAPANATAPPTGSATGRPLQVTVGPRPTQTAQAEPPASFDQRWRGTPVGTEAEARAAIERGKAQLAIAARVGGINKDAAEKAKAAAEQNFERAKQIFEYLGKYNEPTGTMKDVASGAEERKGQIAADTKYYDSLHRGLAGSAMITAQQKQNLHALMDVAPASGAGFGADGVLAMNRMAARLGINPAGAAPRELFNSLAARVLADQFSGIKSMASETGEQGARIFKPMLDIEEKANITPQDSPEGVMAKLKMMDKAGDLMMRWGDKADDYKLAHGKLDAGFDKELRADIASWRIVGAAGGSPFIAPQAPRLDTREQAVEWARNKGLKPGDPMILPSGKIKAAP